jgi:hypothetical protein
MRYAPGSFSLLTWYAKAPQPTDLVIVLDVHEDMGLGICAGVRIKKGTPLGVYAGQLKTKQECENTGYVTDLNWPPDAPRASQLVVDAGTIGNVRKKITLPSHMLNRIHSGLVTL